MVYLRQRQFMRMGRYRLAQQAVAQVTPAAEAKVLRAEHYAAEVCKRVCWHSKRMTQCHLCERFLRPYNSKSLLW